MAITGTSANDTLTGTAGDDTLDGLGGNDEFVGSGGTDFYDGGTGYDTLNFRDTSSALLVDFAAGTISGGFNGSFVNMERVLAGNGGDSLLGGSGDENLSGRGGADTLEGGAGNDWLWGGGEGAQNHFVFHETGTANADRIGDFVSGADKIVLDGTAMSALGADGNFAAGDARFTANSSGTAQDASDRVIYETDTQQIWYDPDGNGSAARQLVATLQSGATLTATDIVVQGSGTPPPGAINGTAGDDTLVGTAGDDTINGLGGNDSISGLAGHDSLSGGDGNDTMDGGLGTDTLDGGLGNDTYITGGGGIGADADVITDAGGIDTLIAFNAFAPMPSGIENLTLEGGPFNSGIDIYVSSGNGNELNNLIVNHRLGSTGLDGGAGDDTLIGSAGGMNWFSFSSNDSGNYGNDVVDGNGGGTMLLAPGPGVSVDFRAGTMTGGGTGSVSFSNIDAAQGSGAADLMIANDAGVSLYGDAGDDTLLGGVGDDYLSGDGYRTSDAPQFTIGDDSLSGGAGDDTLDGGRGDDVLNGDSGNDIFAYFFETDYGNDTLDGGAGSDTLRMQSGSLVVIDLGGGTMSGGVHDGGSPSSAVLANIENVDLSLSFSEAQITGSSSANLLAAGSADDTINGAAGIDTLEGGGGADRFVFDELGAANADHVMHFTSGEDAIHLDANAMAELGASGAFAPGDARFYAAAGASGGHDADDRVVYDTASGNLWYDGDGNGAQAAQLVAILDGPALLSAPDIVVDNGGAIADQHLVGTAGDDNIVGGSGNDTLEGLAGLDTLDGAGGNDLLAGGSGWDNLTGGAGQDTFAFAEYGSGMNDSITDFVSGADTLQLDAAAFTAIGAAGTFAAGDPRFWAAPGASAGHDADDRIVYDTSSGILYYDADGSGPGDEARIATLAGAPTLAATDIVVVGEAGPTGEDIVGTSGRDTLVGGDGNDTLEGLGDNDELIGSAGSDFYDGGSGYDTLNFRDASTALVVDFAGGTTSGGFNGTVVNMERVLGGNAGDSLLGGAGDENLSGRGGADTLEGGAGNDWLWGGGEGAANVFVFRATGTANADRIGDFVHGADKIALDNAAMAALGADGDFASADARFYAASGASGGHDANDRMVYDTSTGRLYYDDDGSGAHAAQLVATLEGAPSLAASDISVI